MTPASSLSALPRRKGTSNKRHTPGVMNENERAYASILQLSKMRGEIDDYQFEPIQLRLGERCTYTPDFAIYEADGQLSFVEVKAWWKPSKAKLRLDPLAKGRVGWVEDARVKIKAAAARFPHFRFRATWWKDGRWEAEEFEP